MASTGYVPPIVSSNLGGTIDPKSEKTFGYRSQHNLTPTPNEFFGGSYLSGPFRKLSYNGFQFPPTTQVKATFVQEYDSARRAIKYITLALTVEAIITQFDTEEASPSSPNTDKSMDIIRQRLSEPGQPLYAQGHGAGTIIINDTNNRESMFDLDYGPKPQVIDWEPVAGSLATRIQWLVVTRIPPCKKASEGFFYFLNNTVGEGVIDFSWNASWGFDEAGWMTRTIKGKIELAQIRTPQPNDTSAGTSLDLAAIMQRFEKIMEVVRGLFPPAINFSQRKENFSISDDKKILSFEFNEEEIRSPQGYPQGALTFDLTESLDSSIKEGFKRWNWNLSGDITVPVSRENGTTNTVNNKRLAFYAFYTVLRDRLNRAANVGSPQDNPGDSISPGETKTQEIVFIPNKIKISNEIFGMGISVQIGYTLICTSSLVVQACGMFDRVRSSEFSFREWRKFMDESGYLYKRFEGILPSKDIVVDFCHPLVTQSSESSSDFEDSSSETTSIYSECPPEERSWMLYDNRFEMTRDSNTITATTISASAQYKTDGLPPGVNQAGADNGTILKMNEAVSDGDANPIQIAAYAEAVTYVKMIGSATRIGYPINAPNLLSIGGYTAVSIGQDIIIPESKPIGLVKFQNGAGCSIHRLSWERNYAINGNIRDFSNVRTTGRAEFYG